MESFRKAYGALKDSTKVGLAKVNSEFKDLDIAIVKATNHVEYPPKERHVRKIFLATTVSRPRSDVAYCIHALSRRLTKTRSWIVAIKTLIVIHRILREGDPTFREELLNYSHRGYIFQLSNFKDDSSPLAWDCSAWVRTYALFLEERLECFRTIRYDVESECITKTSHGTSKVHSRTRFLNGDELLEQLPTLQQLLYRLIGCRPEGAACYNFLVQYALALVLKESFKIYCAINDGIINLVDMFFDMSKHVAIKSLSIYQKAGQQAKSLADFYDICRRLDLARTFHFPTLRQPPPSFLATMEEYIREAPHIDSISNRMLEYQAMEQEVQEPTSKETQEQAEEFEKEEEGEVSDAEEPHAENVAKDTPVLISTEEPANLLDLNEVNPIAKESEDNNALVLAIIESCSNPTSTNNGLTISNTSGWELALVTAPSNNNNQHTNQKMAGGFNKLLLDSLYEDDAARRQHNTGYRYDMPIQNPFGQQDPFAMSSVVPPPTNVQMALMSQQQQQQQQMMLQQQQQNNTMVIPNPYASQYSQQQQVPCMGFANPFGDPFSYPQSSMSSQGNNAFN